MCKILYIERVETGSFFLERTETRTSRWTSNAKITYRTYRQPCSLYARMRVSARARVSRACACTRARSLSTPVRDNAMQWKSSATPCHGLVYTEHRLRWKPLSWYVGRASSHSLRSRPPLAHLPWSPPSIPPDRYRIIKVARQWRRAKERSGGKRGLFSAMEKSFSRDKHNRSADLRCGRGRNSKSEAGWTRSWENEEGRLVQYEYMKEYWKRYILWKREKIISNTYLSQI